jgi:hypothetical protein
MIEAAINTKTTDSNLSQWLFNPFRYVAGFQALLMGLVIILISGLIGSFSNTHFDGVLDVHTGAAKPLWFFLAEGLIDWMCMTVPLIIFGFIVSRSSFRIIDVIGTQALARWPYLIAALAMLPNANRRVLEYIMSKVTQAAPAVTINPADEFIFGFAMILLLLTVIWMVTLMYRAYAVSCNIKGARAVVTFIVSVILAEALSVLFIRVLLVSLQNS